MYARPEPSIGVGPSPRGWGEQIIVCSWNSYFRTIPTRVGRTFFRASASVDSADHPHAGGENSPNISSRDIIAGPSPRGWGELRSRRRKPPSRRTIPTRVGRTTRDTARCARSPDHPHAGGENLEKKAPPTDHTGPSPRGWGEPPVEYILSVYTRTIPTRVGRTDKAESPKDE